MRLNLLLLFLAFSCFACAPLVSENNCDFSTFGDIEFGSIKVSRSDCQYGNTELGYLLGNFTETFKY